jgi:hypothetical protein
VDNHFGKIIDIFMYKKMTLLFIYRAIQIQDSENILNENVLQTLKTRDLAVNIYQNGTWGSYVHRHLQTSNGMQ